MKNLSGNSLSELQALMAEINKLVDRDYLHVEEHLPVNLRKQIKNFTNKLIAERERRENLF